MKKILALVVVCLFVASAFGSIVPIMSSYVQPGGTLSTTDAIYDSDGISTNTNAQTSFSLEDGNVFSGQDYFTPSPTSLTNYQVFCKTDDPLIVGGGNSNKGIATHITAENINVPMAGDLSFWVSEDIGDYWAQIGYRIYGGFLGSNTPYPFYEIFYDPNHDGTDYNIILVEGDTPLSAGITYRFAIEYDGGTTWKFTLNDQLLTGDVVEGNESGGPTPLPNGYFDFGVTEAEYVASSFAFVAFSTEKKYGSTDFDLIPTVNVPIAFQVLQNNDWYTPNHGITGITIGTPDPTPWGIEGNLQDQVLEFGELNVGSSVPSIWNGDDLWLSPDLVDYDLSPTTIEPGDTFQLEYQIYNPNTYSVDVGLGASIRPHGTTIDIWDTSNDDIVTIPPLGTYVRFRDFVTSLGLSMGDYDVAWRIWTDTPGNSNSIEGSGWQDNRLTLAASQTSISITEYLNPPTCYPADLVEVYGTATFNNGDPVTNTDVTITVSGSSWTATTDSSGYYSKYITAPGSAGSYSVEVSITTGTLFASNSKTLTVQSTSGGTDYNIQSWTSCKGVQGSSPWNPIDETEVFRTTDSTAYTWINFTNVVVSLNVKWEWYRPDDTYYWEATATIPAPAVEWLWYHIAYGIYISGFPPEDIEGRWKCKVSIDEGSGYFHKFTDDYTIRYEVVQRTMCKDVGPSPSYDPITPTDSFLNTDTWAYAWIGLENVAESLQIEWKWYGPSGSLYTTVPYTIPDPSTQGYPYYDWYHYWCRISIYSAPPQSMCGQWRVESYIKDVYGNWDLEYSQYFTITDNTPPGTPGTPTNPDIYSNSSSVTWSWTAASEDDVVTQYHLQVGSTLGGNDAYDAYIGNVLSKEVYGLSDGQTYYARVRAMNREGMWSSWSGDSDGITIDTQPPITTYVLSGTSGTNGWFVSNVTVTLSASDVTTSVSSTKYKIDNGSWQTYSAVPFNISTEGNHKVYYYSIDTVGNQEQERNFTVKIDKSNPIILSLGILTPTSIGGKSCSIIFADEMNTSVNPSVTFGLSSPYNTHVISGSWTSSTTWSGTFDVTTTTGDGINTLSVSGAKDMAGNEMDIDTSNNLVIDTVDPSTTPSIEGTTGNDNWYTSSVSTTLSSFDSTSGVKSTKFQIDKESWTDYSTLIHISDDGVHEIKYYSVDYADNTEPTQNVTFKIDATPPESSINTLSAKQCLKSFTMNWSGSDSTSGLKWYDVQYKEGSSGTWINWITQATNTSAIFNGQDGHTYYFQSRAQDEAGNWESYPGGNGDTYTRVDITGWLKGHVYESGTTTPISEVTILVGSDSDTTDSSGYYNISLSAGSYSAVASKSGYNSDSKPVTINIGQTTTQDFYLIKISNPGWAVGYVYVSNTTIPISGATVAVSGGPTTVTESNGYYNITLEAGDRTLIVTKTGYSSESEFITIIEGQETTTNFYLREDTDNDGLPDSWEQTYFGNLDQGANDDPDGDGYNNSQEYARDSDPTDDTDPPDDTPGYDILAKLWLWIIIIIVIVTAISLYLYFKRKTKEESSMLPPPPEIDGIEKTAPAMASGVAAKERKPLTGRNKSNAEVQLKEYKRKLNKGYKSGKLTKEQCLTQVKKFEIKLGLRPPNN